MTLEILMMNDEEFDAVANMQNGMERRKAEAEKEKAEKEYLVLDKIEWKEAIEFHLLFPFKKSATIKMHNYYDKSGATKMFMGKPCQKPLGINCPFCLEAEKMIAIARSKSEQDQKLAASALAKEHTVAAIWHYSPNKVTDLYEGGKLRLLASKTPDWEGNGSLIGSLLSAANMRDISDPMIDLSVTRGGDSINKPVYITKRVDREVPFDYTQVDIPKLRKDVLKMFLNEKDYTLVPILEGAESSGTEKALPARRRSVAQASDGETVVLNGGGRPDKDIMTDDDLKEIATVAGTTLGRARKISE